MQRHFDEQIQKLLEKLVGMGRLAESMIQTALRTPIECNESLCDAFRNQIFRVLLT